MTNWKMIAGKEDGEIAVYGDEDGNRYISSLTKIGKKYRQLYKKVFVWKDGDITFAEGNLDESEVIITE